MAIQATVCARVRAGGNQLNGGLYDPAMAGAGTDYTDQDAPQLSLTDLACANNTTLTSATGGFTSVMVGNGVRISAGTNFTPGYYMVTGFTNGNTVTLDRNPTTGATASAGTGRLGGAFATMQNFRNGGDLPQPTIAASGLVVAGMKIYVRGAGTDDPANASVDYDYDGGYATYPNGSLTVGPVKVIGYNGRPNIHVSPLFGYTTDYWHIENLKLVCNSTPYAAEGFWSGATYATNVYFENGGNDIYGWRGSRGVSASRFIGTGAASSADNRPAIAMGDYSGVAVGNFIKGWRADGILLGSSGNVILFNVIKSCGKDAIRLEGSSVNLGSTIIGNTLDGNTRDGLRIVTSAGGLQSLTMFNNCITNNGGYGFNVDFGSAAANDLVPNRYIGYNNFYNNTSGARRFISARTGDLAVDPLYTNAAADDYKLQASSPMRTVGFPVYPYPGMT